MEEKGVVERGTEVERIVYFSDGVFAVAITLLALQIRVPGGLSPRELFAGRTCYAPPTKPPGGNHTAISRTLYKVVNPRERGESPGENRSPPVRPHSGFHEDRSTRRTKSRSASMVCAESIPCIS